MWMYAKMEETDKKLVKKVDVLTNFQRCSNLRIKGFLEGVEGRNIIAFLKEWLPKLLNLPTSAPRTQQGSPYTTEGHPVREGLPELSLSSCSAKRETPAYSKHLEQRGT